MSVFRFQAKDTSTPVSQKSRSRGGKSPPSFAFSTSPSILQDITMDKTTQCPSPKTVPDFSGNDDSLVMVDHDSRSIPSLPDSEDEFSISEMCARGATGLTMKEYDENLKKLTAENFQLKLKIYFLNERIARVSGLQDKGAIHENIQLKVDNQQKAQEVERQSKLLVQSLEVIEKLQSEHQEKINELVAKHDAELVKAHVQIGALETRLRIIQDSSDLTVDEAARIEKMRDMQQKFEESVLNAKKLENVNHELKTKLEKLEKTAQNVQEFVDERETLLDRIKSYENQLTQLQSQETALQTDTNTQIIQKHGELEAQLSSRTAELAAVQASYDRACETIKSFISRVSHERNRNKQLETDLDNARAEIEELELRLGSEPTQPSRLLITSRSCQCGVEKVLARISELEEEVLVLQSGPEGDLSSQLKVKEAELESVKIELKKRTYFLQELVNKELWEKNRRIEKLEKKLAADDVEALKKQIDSLRVENNVLANELMQIQEIETTFKDTFYLLSKRLEELVVFLDSLITDRSLVQCNPETYTAIQRAIDSSRELSRRFTVSFHELSLLTHKVPISIVSYKDECSSNSRESEPLTLSEVRESEKRRMKLEMPELSDNEEKSMATSGIRRKMEKFVSRTLGGNRGEMDASESEAWSEPDRSVSLARMGHIDSASVTPLRLSKSKNSSGSSEETLNETAASRTPGKRTRSTDPEMRRLLAKVKNLEETNKDLKSQLTLLENKHAILSKLHGDSTPKFFVEMQESLDELDDLRRLSQRLRADLDAALGDLADAQCDLGNKELLCAEQKDTISKLRAKVDDLAMECNLRVAEVTEEKDAAVKRVQAMENSLANAEALRIAVEKQVAEINRKLYDTQNRSQTQVREAGKKLDSCEKILRDKTEYEKKIQELQLYIEGLQKTVEEKQNQVDSWTARAQREHEEASDLKRRLLETERSKTVVEMKIKEEGERIKWMDDKLRELEQALEQCEKETEATIVNQVQRRVEAETKELKKEWVPRVDLERARSCIEKLEGRLKSYEDAHEKCGGRIKKLNKIETEKREWKRQMSDLRLRCSEMEVELTRIKNEKIGLEDKLHLATEKWHEAEKAVLNLQKQVEDETNGSTASAVFHDFLSSRNLNNSPDLGIESDQGRFSSLEHQDQRPRRVVVDGNANRLETENVQLRQQVEKLSQKLEETIAELTTSNYQKKQMERAICKQLHKTHHMLKKTRQNFEDSDDVDGR